MKIEASPECNKCSDSNQTLTHLFTQCTLYRDLWQKIIFILNLASIPKGYLNADNFSIPINTILMVTKHYIFVTSLNVTARPKYT